MKLFYKRKNAQNPFNKGFWAKNKGLRFRIKTVVLIWLQTHILIQWGGGVIWFHFDLQGFHILFMVALY